MEDIGQQHRDMVSWANSILSEQGAGDIETFQEIAATPYSYVARIATATGDYYIKKTPPDLFIEAKILKLIRTHYPDASIPRLIESNNALGCFISKSCGNVTLRTLFDNKLDEKLLRRGLQSYKDIQKETAPHIDEYLAAGIADWRLGRLPQLYNHFVTDQTFLKECGIDDSLCHRLLAAQDDFAQLCGELAGRDITDGLNHSDLQENNMVINPASGAIAVIDWGEVTIGNPLLPIAGLFKKICRRYSLPEKSPARDNLLRQFMQGYPIPDQDISHVYDLASAVDDIYYALTLVDLITRTQYRSPKWMERIKWSCMEFINNRNA